jgi:hypothetical protein
MAPAALDSRASERVVSSCDTADTANDATGEIVPRELIASGAQRRASTLEELRGVDIADVRSVVLRGPVAHTMRLGSGPSNAVMMCI